MLDNTNIMVELSFFSDDFNVKDVTKKLGIEPTEIYIKGNKSRLGQIRNETCWSYRTEYIETYEAEVAYKIILDIFQGKTQEIFELVKKYNFICKINFVINILDNERPYIKLNKEIVKFAADIGAYFDFEQYYY